MKRVSSQVLLIWDSTQFKRTSVLFLTVHQMATKDSLESSLEYLALLQALLFYNAQGIRLA